MVLKLTQQEIEECRAILKENPIDHKWDEVIEDYLDAKVPKEQLVARAAYNLLKRAGELGNLEEK